MADYLLTFRMPRLGQYGFGTENMRRIKVCAFCGAPCEAERKRCPECGAGLPKETLYEAYKKRNSCCPECGTVVLNGAVYCPNCGKNLK